MKTLLLLLILFGCGKDHEGVGQLRIRWACNWGDPWNYERRTISNPSEFCNREFNRILRDLENQCGGRVIIDEQFCGVAQDGLTLDTWEKEREEFTPSQNFNQWKKRYALFLRGPNESF